jgi:hypothetical protein
VGLVVGDRLGVNDGRNVGLITVGAGVGDLVGIGDGGFVGALVI